MHDKIHLNEMCAIGRHLIFFSNISLVTLIMSFSDVAVQDIGQGNAKKAQVVAFPNNIGVFAKDLVAAEKKMTAKVN